MQAGLIFYRAHRTFQNKIAADQFLTGKGCQLLETRAVADEQALFGALSTLLRTCELVLVVSAEDSGEEEGLLEPAASAVLFKRLGVKTGPNGPEGVLRLKIACECADLLESADRAIFLLPDEPQRLGEFLNLGQQRLAEKFYGCFAAGENGQPVSGLTVSLEQAVEESMGNTH